MKMKDVSYNQEKIELLFKFPIIKANLELLKIDFEGAYDTALNTDMPEEVPETHLESLKSDLFTAFCHGARLATYTDSNYRRGFNLPTEVMDEMRKSKIILPDNEIKTPSKKLILE